MKWLFVRHRPAAHGKDQPAEAELDQLVGPAGRAQSEDARDHDERDRREQRAQARDADRLERSGDRAVDAAERAGRPQPMISFGSHVTTPGTKVISTSTAKIEIMNGTSSRASSTTPTRATDDIA